MGQSSVGSGALYDHLTTPIIKRDMPCTDTPQRPSKDLLWKASGLSWDNIKSGRGVLKYKMH